MEFVSNGGGKAAAALNVVSGANAVARLLSGLVRKNLGSDTETLHLRMNGAAGLLITTGGRPSTAFTFDCDEDGRVATVYMVRNPDKLSHLSPTG